MDLWISQTVTVWFKKKNLNFTASQFTFEAAPHPLHFLCPLFLLLFSSLFVFSSSSTPPPHPFPTKLVRGKLFPPLFVSLFPSASLLFCRYRSSVDEKKVRKKKKKRRKKQEKKPSLAIASCFLPPPLPSVSPPLCLLFSTLITANQTQHTPLCSNPSVSSPSESIGSPKANPLRQKGDALQISRHSLRHKDT